MVRGRNAIAIFWKEEARQAELRTVAERLGDNTASVIATSAERTRESPPRGLRGKGPALAQKVGNM
jgi:hypothetical protein